MDSPATFVREMRLGAGLSQRALASRAGTSQPAIARYELGQSTPSLKTLRRLAEACGHRVVLSADPVPEPHDLGLARGLLDLTPAERLRALRRHAGLRVAARES